MDRERPAFRTFREAYDAIRRGKGHYPNFPIVNEARTPPWRGKPMNMVRWVTIVLNAKDGDVRL